MFIWNIIFPAIVLRRLKPCRGDWPGVERGFREWGYGSHMSPRGSDSDVTIGIGGVSLRGRTWGRQRRRRRSDLPSSQGLPALVASHFQKVLLRGLGLVLVWGIELPVEAHLQPQRFLVKREKLIVKNKPLFPIRYTLHSISENKSQVRIRNCHFIQIQIQSLKNTDLPNISEARMISISSSRSSNFIIF
jgi:hypothetical protein